MRLLCKAALFVGACFLVASVQADDRILHIGNSAEPSTLDPHRYFSNAEEHLLKDLFVGLTTMGPQGEILPGVATDWEVSTDGKSWLFNLEESATWSDGSPLTAHDFVFGLQRHQDPTTASPLAHFLYCIKNAEAVNRGELKPNQLGVAALDDHTLQINLERPFPFLLERLLYPIAYPIPKHAVDAHGDDWVRAENWVSNGPYVLSDWRPQNYVEMVRNEHFESASDIKVERLRYHPFNEPMTAYNRYIADEMDVIHAYPHALIDTVSQERPMEVKNSLLQSIMYLVVNMNDPQLSDQRLREVIAIAIHRERITELILGAGELPSATLTPPIVSGYQLEDVKANSSTETARTLLADLGYDDSNPLKVKLRYISGTENKRVYVAIAAMWQEAGIQTELHHTNLATHFSDLQNGDFQIAQAGWFGENNPEHYIELLWSKIGPANYGRYSSSRFDNLFEVAREIADTDLRLEKLAEAERLALTEFPVIPLYVTTTLNLVKPHVGGWLANGRNLHPVRYLYWQ